MPKKSYEDTCVRCDEFGAGTKKLMFYRWLETFPKLPIVYEFFCHRCQRIMKVYSIVGFILLGGILVAAVGAYIWIKMLEIE